jgi:hypothetical protein
VVALLNGQEIQWRWVLGHIFGLGDCVFELGTSAEPIEFAGAPMLALRHVTIIRADPIRHAIAFVPYFPASAGLCEKVAGTVVGLIPASGLLSVYEPAQAAIDEAKKAHGMTQIVSPSPSDRKILKLNP